MSDTSNSVTVQTIVSAPLETVWNCWTSPEHIQEWNAASDDWHTTHVTNDLRVGGTFSARMEARDQSVGFDFSGTYTEVIPHEKIAYILADNRKVEITFVATDDGVHITEIFDTEQENSAEMQRTGWQAILDSFKHHTENVANTTS